MEKSSKRKLWGDSIKYVNCWLRLSERMLRANASPAERALRYSRHFLNGLSAESMLNQDAFWSIAQQFMALHEEFYVYEMDIAESYDGAYLTVDDYNRVMYFKEAKHMFMDLELDVLRAMHNNEHAMKAHKCELTYSYACKVDAESVWLRNNELPRWIVEADAAIEHVRTLFVE